MTDFKLGDAVKWSSQAQGHTKEKTGVIVEVVEAGQRPDRVRFPDLYKGPGVGFGRQDASYVVLVGKRKHYWPLASKLQPVNICAHYNGTGQEPTHDR